MSEESLDVIINSPAPATSRAGAMVRLAPRLFLEAQMGFWCAGELQDKYTERVGCWRFRPMALSLAECVVISGAKAAGSYFFLHDNPSSLETVAGVGLGGLALVPLGEATWRVWYVCKYRCPVGGIIGEFGYRAIIDVVRRMRTNGFIANRTDASS